MFKFKKKAGQTVEIKIDGMHCVSCSLNIDDALENTEGVLSSNTSYAKSKTKVVYDGTKTTPEKILIRIKDTGYAGVVV
ncbi:heavy-metal-associated domain-containing protein [Candidatus Microgenomates bacterium]|nr:MAG: heavy-metal-associated domain-containing protein [Candidatus Microgenomates bacterium]